MKIKDIILVATIFVALLLSGCTGQDEKKVLDSDHDGIPDTSDAFPHDPAASKDSDGDGHPDEWTANWNSTSGNTNLTLDVFPNDPTEWKDTDKDGYGDNSDQLPLDSKHHKITYLITERTDTLSPEQEKSQNLEMKAEYKDVVFYWRLSTSSELAGQTIYMRYKTPLEWSQKYRGTTNSIQRSVSILGTWLFVMGHEGHVTGYYEDITVTYRVYALE